MSDAYEVVEVLNNACVSFDRIAEHNEARGDGLEAVYDRLTKLTDELSSFANEVDGWKDHEGRAVTQVYGAAIAAHEEARSAHTALQYALRGSQKAGRHVLHLAEYVLEETEQSAHRLDGLFSSDMRIFITTLHAASRMGKGAQASIEYNAKATKGYRELFMAAQKAILDYRERLA